MAAAAPMVADLRAESDDLDALVAPLPAHRWADPTPAPGWTIAHQIGHLLWTDRVALTSVTDEAQFAELLQAAQADPTGFVDAGAEDLSTVAPAELLAEWRDTAAEKGMRHVAGRSLRWIIGSRMRRRVELPASILWPLIAAAPAHAFVSQVNAILDADDGLREELATLDVPTLVITGSQDILTPVGDAEELAETIPGAELVIVPGAAHAVMVDRAPAFNEAVLSFLDRHRAAADDADASPAGLASVNLPLASA